MQPPLRIVIDVRHIKDFGIGTYIRNLVKALGELDTHNHYLLAANSADVPDLPAVPGNFETVVRRREPLGGRGRGSYGPEILR